MSWRTWLGSGKQDFADYNLCDYPDLRALCNDAKWHLPAKVFAPDTDVMARFLTIMEDDFFMPPSEFSVLVIENAPSDHERWKPYEPVSVST